MVRARRFQQNKSSTYDGNASVGIEYDDASEHTIFSKIGNLLTHQPPSPTRIDGEIECDYDENPTDIFLHLQRKEWSEALGQCLRQPYSARTWVYREEKRTKKLKWRLLPLHAAFLFKAPDELIKTLLVAYPRATRLIDDQGKLPLHHSISKEYSESVVRLVLTTFPEATDYKDGKGRAPVDLVTASNLKNRDVYMQILSEDSDVCSLDGFDSIPSVQKSGSHIYEVEYDVAPTALFLMLHRRQWTSAIDQCQKNPIESKTWVYRKTESGYKTSWRLLPIHAALIYGAPDSVILSLLEAHPMGVRDTNDQGMLPIHLAFRHGYSKKIVDGILLHYPNSVEAMDNKGRTPLDLVVPSNSPTPETFREALARGTDYYVSCIAAAERANFVVQKKALFDGEMADIELCHDKECKELRTAINVLKDEAKRLRKTLDSKLEANEVVVGALSSLESQVEKKIEAEKQLARKVVDLDFDLNEIKEEEEYSVRLMKAQTSQLEKDINNLKGFQRDHCIENNTGTNASCEQDADEREQDADEREQDVHEREQDVHEREQDVHEREQDEDDCEQDIKECIKGNLELEGASKLDKGHSKWNIQKECNAKMSSLEKTFQTCEQRLDSAWKEVLEGHKKFGDPDYNLWESEGKEKIHKESSKLEIDSQNKKNEINANLNNDLWSTDENPWSLFDDFELPVLNILPKDKHSESKDNVSTAASEKDAVPKKDPNPWDVEPNPRKSNDESRTEKVGEEKQEYSCCSFSRLDVNVSYDEEENAIVNVQVELLNRGVSPAYEIVQCYIRSSHLRDLRPDRDLRDFESCSVQPGSAQKIEFSLTAEKFWFEDVVDNCNPTQFDVCVGPASNKIKLKKHIDICHNEKLEATEQCEAAKICKIVSSNTAVNAERREELSMQKCKDHARRSGKAARNR